MAAVLVSLSRSSLPALALASAFLLDESPPLRALAEALAALALLPAVAAALLARAHAVSLREDPNGLHLEGRGGTFEVPFGAITSARVWRAPVPEPGMTLALRGRGLPARLDLGARDPSEILVFFERSGVAVAQAAASSPALVWAHARAGLRPGFAQRGAVKFVLFALLPAAILFNAHQHIAYGGPLGQYHLLGLRAFLQTFAEYWVTVAIYLLLYASVWRGLAELVCFFAACVAPPRAAAVRRAAERACLVLYYVGVPALIGLRFLI